MRTLAISDIHGCLRALEALLNEVEPRPDDLVITLGDYVDKGPETRGAIERVLRLRESCRCVSLIGNHDLKMLAARDDADTFRNWLEVGGREALQSYGAPEDAQAWSAAVPPRHWQFLEHECVPYFETDTHLFTHANLAPRLPLAEQPEEQLYHEKIRPDAWQPHISGKTLICGHHAQHSGRPLVLERAVCIDTWVYGDGWMTCLDVASGVYWQANERGETRLGKVE